MSHLSHKSMLQLKSVIAGEFMLICQYRFTSIYAKLLAPWGLWNTSLMFSSLLDEAPFPCMITYNIHL